MFSICFRKHRDQKKENNLLTLIIKMQVLFAGAITTSTARASSVSPSLHTAAEPAVHAAVKNLVSYRNDTKTAFFFAAS